MVYLFTFFYLFLDFNFSFTSNFFGLIKILFSILTVLVYSVALFSLDLLSLVYNFWKLILLFYTNTPVLYYKNSALSFLHLYSSILISLLLMITLFIFSKATLLFYNNNLYSQVGFKLTYYFNTSKSFFDLHNFIFIFKLFPVGSKWYKPFVLNNLGGFPQILNFNLLYFRSFLIKLKNDITLISIYSFNYLVHCCKLILFSARFIVWKPLFKKTSYFGIYNSFKNKY